MEQTNDVVSALESMALTPEAPILKARFVCDLAFCRYSFKSGKEAIFMNHEYLTDNEGEIKELMAEIEQNHPMIHIDKDRAVVDVRVRDPIEAIREQERMKLIEEAKRIATSKIDMGDSKQGTLNVANTQSSADAMSGSTSTDGAAAQAGTVVAAAPVAGSTVGKITVGPLPGKA